VPQRPACFLRPIAGSNETLLTPEVPPFLRANSVSAILLQIRAVGATRRVV